MRNRTTMLVTLVLALALAAGLSACGRAQTPPPAEPSQSTPVSPTLPADFSYLSGGWWMDFELVEIDDPALAESATPTDAAWVIDATGTQMYVFTKRYDYFGTVTPDGDGWVYEGSSSMLDDESGVTWTSTMVLRVPAGTESGFSGTIELSEQSDADGQLYTGTWNITAALQ